VTFLKGAINLVNSDKIINTVNIFTHGTNSGARLEECLALGQNPSSQANQRGQKTRGYIIVVYSNDIIIITSCIPKFLHACMNFSKLCKEFSGRYPVLIYRLKCVFMNL